VQRPSLPLLTLISLGVGGGGRSRPSGGWQLAPQQRRAARIPVAADFQHWACLWWIAVDSRHMDNSRSPSTAIKLAAVDLHQRRQALPAG